MFKQPHLISAIHAYFAEVEYTFCLIVLISVGDFPFQNKTLYYSDLVTRFSLLLINSHRYLVWKIGSEKIGDQHRKTRWAKDLSIW